MKGLLPPSPKTQKKIKETLYQDPEVTARDVQHIKDWLRKQPHLPQIEDDVRIERFLYGCKYRLERCKEVLDMYYTVRAAVPEFYGRRDPLDDNIQNVFKVLFTATSPKMTPEGYRVSFFGLLDVDPSKFDLLSQAKLGLMLLDTHLKLETWLGSIHVIDLKDVTMAHVTRCTPTTVKKFLVCLQDAFPVRIGGVHVINAPSFIDLILSLIKPFVKEKIWNRIHVHTSLNTLYDFFPKEVLPNEYGGQAGSVRDISDFWRCQVVKNRDWFLSEEHKVADEGKRVGKIAHIENLFGVEGSFKKLSID